MEPGVSKLAAGPYGVLTAIPADMLAPPAEDQQTISGRFASDDITQDRLDIRSCIDSARKHGHNTMDVLHQHK
jgi:hypothetical protein